MRRSNCLIYVIGRMLRDPLRGKMIIGKSMYGWWPHFMFMDRNGVISEFVPDGPKRRRLLPPPIFTGHVETVTRKETP